MQELVIVIPDLYLGESPKAGSRPQPLAGFEHALRFGSRSRIGDGWRSWLANWAGRPDLARASPASVAAAAMSSGAGAWTAAPPFAAAPAAAEPPATMPAVNTVWIATPLHLQAGLTTLHVDRRSLLRLAPGELHELCADFARVFGESDLRLQPLASGEALLTSPSTPDVQTVEPARFVDADVGGALPEGPGSGYLRRLGAEIEMWLHEHPVNQARVARRDLPVSTLWLWGNDSLATPGAQGDHSGSSAPPGSGAPPGSANAPDRSGRQARDVEAFGSDIYVQGLCRLQGSECRPLPESLGGVAVGTRSNGGRAVIVVSVGELWREGGTFLDALNEVDRRFIEPAGRAVRTGVYRQLSILANDRLTVLTERDHLRLWRRPRAALEALRWT